MVADEQLTHIHAIAPQAATGTLPLGAPPAVDAVAGGSVSHRGACLLFKPASFSPMGSNAQLQLTIPPAGVMLRPGAAGATVGVRRFAQQFQTIRTVVAGGRATLRIAADLAAQPWHVQVTAVGGAVVCGLR